MITQDDIDAFAPEEYIPEWAEAKIDNKMWNGYRAIRGQLSTKDGRRTGNAVVVSHETRHGIFVTRVITDAGNCMYLTNNEIVELFYEPRYVMKAFMAAVQEILIMESAAND
tara:strand:- start:1504 stop:1839 length:336 start_codon:yes stop_codon:yes gene_type:complete